MQLKIRIKSKYKYWQNWKTIILRYVIILFENPKCLKSTESPTLLNVNISKLYKSNSNNNKKMK